MRVAFRVTLLSSVWSVAACGSDSGSNQGVNHSGAGSAVVAGAAGNGSGARSGTGGADAATGGGGAGVSATGGATSNGVSGAGGSMGGSMGGTPGVAASGGKGAGVGGRAGGGSAGIGAEAGVGPMGGAAGMLAGGTGGAPSVDDSLFTVSSMLASEVDAKAPTTVGIVTWSAKVTVTSAHLEFGRDTTYGMQAPVDLTAPDYRTLLLGMKPNTEYHFRVVASDGSANHASGDHTIKTGAATTAVKIGSFDVKQATGREGGFIVTSYWAGTGSSVAFILDADGDIVWAYDLGMNGGIARARMSYTGRDMWAVTASNSGESIRRVGMDGLNPQTYSSTKSSHDITAVSGDTMAYLDYSVSCNDINEIDPSGTTKKVFTASAVFGAMCHGNAVRYSEAEDEYTFSVVDKDVIRVSRSGEKLWSLASTVSGGNASWGGINHGHHLLRDSILIFANKGGASSSSAMVEYDFSGKEIASYENGSVSQNLGDVQRLPGGNLLIDFSNAGVMHEVTKEGTVLVEIKAGSSQNRFGYATWRPTLYGSSPDITD